MKLSETKQLIVHSQLGAVGYIPYSFHLLVNLYFAPSVEYLPKKNVNVSQVFSRDEEGHRKNRLGQV